MRKTSGGYGKELILDLHDCNPKYFNRNVIKAFFVDLCDLIGMQRTKLTWWDDVNVPLEERETEAHLKGTSAVQFIKTSSITIHALDMMGNVYINIFSCSDFDRQKVANFCVNFFGGKLVSSRMIIRK